MIQNELYGAGGGGGGAGNPELRQTRSERGLPLKETASFAYKKFHDDHDIGEDDESLRESKEDGVS